MNKLSFRQSFFDFRRARKVRGPSGKKAPKSNAVRMREDSTADKIFESCSVNKLSGNKRITNKAVDPHSLVDYLKQRGYTMSEAEVFEICSLVKGDNSSHGLLEYHDFIAVIKNCRMKRRQDPLLSTAFTQLGAVNVKDTIDFSRIMKSIPILKETLGVDTEKFNSFCKDKHDLEDKIDFNEFAAIIVQITSIIEPLDKEQKDAT